MNSFSRFRIFFHNVFLTPLSRFTLKLFVFGVFLGSGSLAVIFIATSPSIGQSNDDDDLYRQLSLFGDVFELIRESYVDDVSDEDLIHSAISGMLQSLDPHSGYISENDLKDVQNKTRGQFGGLGIEVTMEGGYVKVVSPIDDTPASRAGLQSGDLIVMIDGADVLGLDLSQAVEQMRGEIGSSITVTIKRGDLDLFDVSITRAVIKMRSARHESYGNVGYIRITTFSGQTTSGLLDSIDALLTEHGDDLEGVILDLRNNPGGLLREAISVSDAFLDGGEIVSTRGRDTNDQSRHFATEGDALDGLPLVVLINSGSASASEIVAGAIKDHGRGIIMGTRSFGKGSVQTVTPVTGHGAVRLTTARYYTPSGISIQSTGIEPDITVELAIVENIDEGIRREEDLRGALEQDSRITDNSSASVEPSSNLRDYQLSRAIDLLKGLAIYDRVSE